jgi:hypothetical protein
VLAEQEFAERLEIFFGAASEAVCRVYARLEVPNVDGSLRLGGALSGPTCAYAATLQATFPFADRGPGTSLLAEAVVPEPCFWTPEMPHVYRAEVELRRENQSLARVERLFGIRPLGAAGRQLIYAGKGWVLRGVSANELTSIELRQSHDGDTALLVRNPDDARCEAASRIGVLLVVDLDELDICQVRRLARWPAVGAIALRQANESVLKQVSHNVILAQRFAPSEPIRPTSWAQAVICELSTTGEYSSRLSDCSLPMIIHRPAGALESVAAGRAACDRLQRDLAPIGQFAGYIV